MAARKRKKSPPAPSTAPHGEQEKEKYDPAIIRGIDRIRRERRYTSKDLALYLGVEQSRFSKWRGGTGEPTASQILALAKLFDLTVEQIVAAEPNYRDLPPPRPPQEQLLHRLIFRTDSPLAVDDAVVAIVEFLTRARTEAEARAATGEAPAKPSDSASLGKTEVGGALRALLAEKGARKPLRRRKKSTGPGVDPVG